MRPLTKAVFEQEGKKLIGSHWTLEQVRQAYETADNLLDYIAEYKELGFVKKNGIEQTQFGFQYGLEDSIAENSTDESVQSLSLGVLRKLLEHGVTAMVEAANIYREAPETFKAVYASSKPAFFKDKFLQQDVPVNSFAPFKTGENPAMTQDKKLSQLCADLYKNSTSHPHSIACLFFSNGGDSIIQETMLLHEVIESIRESRFGDKDQSFSIIPMRPQNSL